MRASSSREPVQQPDSRSKIWSPRPDPWLRRHMLPWASLIGATLSLLLVGGLVACERSSETLSSASKPVEAGQPTSGLSMRDESVAGLSLRIPEAWTSEPPATPMRVAQYRVPGPDGDAQLLVFRFPGGAGTADANITRWVGQFSQPDGSATKDHAQVQRTRSDALSLTRLDVSGSYSGQQMPGAPPQPAIADGRLLALIVEGSGDPYFFKLLGPAGTVGKWTEAWGRMVDSIHEE